MSVKTKPATASNVALYKLECESSNGLIINSQAAIFTVPLEAIVILVLPPVKKLISPEIKFEKSKLPAPVQVIIPTLLVPSYIFICGFLKKFVSG